MRKFYIIFGLLAILACGQGIAQDQKANNPFIPPQFPGGNDSLKSFLASRLKPLIDSLAFFGEKGKVIVIFKVDSTGAVSDFKVWETFDQDVGDKVVKVLKRMPNWTPGTNKGKPIACMTQLPLNFDHEKSNRRRNKRFKFR